jgi:hypothetical protein
MIRYNSRSIINVLTIGIFGTACFDTVFSQEAATYPMIGTRQANVWTIPLEEKGPTKIPRVFASLRGASFQGFPDSQLTVNPDIHFWEIKYTGDRKSANAVLEFDSPPQLVSETKAIEQAGDGTITLACSQGLTAGEKLRFEPQPHKNTIGYWTVASDSVSWNIKVHKPFGFNVGILQGCGPKGGGTAKVSLLKGSQTVDKIEFDVQPTGHFQNFVWRHVGVLTVADAGEYTIRIGATKINEVALMDVRQMHLSPKR